MKKRLTLSAGMVVLVLVMATQAQDIYLPVKSLTNRMALMVPPPLGQSVLLSDVSLPSVPITVVIPRTLFAIPNAAIGQAAVDACNAMTTQPIQDPANPTGSISCENWRRVAINNDIAARVKTAIATIPASTLIAQQLEVVQ